jgi:GAF domain-containing protein
LIGWVYQNRVPLNVPDLRADSRAVFIDSEVRSGMWVPVEHKNQLQGILGVLSMEANAFSSQDERLLTLFANQAAVALENARLFEETQQRTQRQEALYSISTSLGSMQTVAELCELVVRAGKERLGYSHLGIFLLDPLTGDRVLQVQTGWDEASLIERLHTGEGLSEQALRTGELQYCWDVTREPHYVSELRGAHSEVDVPIKTGESVLGVLVVLDPRADAFDNGDFEVLQAVANQLAVALERAKLYTSIRQELADRP